MMPKRMGRETKTITWGVIVSEIVHLRLEEQVRLDRDQLEVLFLQLGAAGSDQLVSHAMEELAVLLSRIETRHRKGEVDDVRKSVKGLVAIAQQVGMTTLARVGRDVLDLTAGHDGAAYCATIARMVRIGESSLVAVWDLQDMSI